VVLKVTQHRKPRPKPLAEVKDAVAQALRAERGAQAAKAAAEAAIKQPVDFDALAKQWGVTAEPARFVGRGDPSLPAALRQAVFEAPKPGASPTARLATLDDGATAIYVIKGARPGNDNSNPQLRAQLASFLAQRAGGGDVAAYIAEMRRTAKVAKNSKVFE
jgi:hypothetical protein